MPDFTLVPPGSALRPACEALVRQVFARCYHASVPSFPDRLIAVLEQDRPVAVAGLRDSATGFFSQAYLDVPVEAALSAAVGSRLDTTDLIEITSLASTSPDGMQPLLRAVLELGRSEGRRAVIFTTVERLRMRLQRMGLPLIDLGPAQAGRIADPDRWGDYYRHDPRVLAVLDFPALRIPPAASSAVEAAHV